MLCKNKKEQRRINVTKLSTTIGKIQNIPNSKEYRNNKGIAGIYEK
jgi:hypothetical protein